MASHLHEYDYSIVPDVDCARLAAFIDGEGCIKVTKKADSRRPGKLYYRFSIEIANTDPRLSQWCKSVFGGIIVFRDMGPKWKDAYTWSATEKRAEAILRRVLPFLLLKRAQADVALAYRDTFRRKCWMNRDPVTGKLTTYADSPELHEKRFEFMAQLTKMKLRGKHSESVQ